MERGNGGKYMIKEIIQIANELDSRGLVNEAGLLDSFITKLSSELDNPESSGELINLDEYRRRAEDEKPKRRERQDPQELMENWKELQRAIEDVQNVSMEDMDLGDVQLTDEHDEFFLVVFDDGETYSGNASVVKVKPSEMQRIEEGEKVFDVIPPDHEAPGAKWFDIWDIVKSTDLSNI
jgi:hypothetical protein